MNWDAPLRMTLASYLGMPDHVRVVFTEWLAKTGLDQLRPVEIEVGARVDGASSMGELADPRWVVAVWRATGKVLGRGSNRHPEVLQEIVEVDEFPPASSWRYFTEKDPS